MYAGILKEVGDERLGMLGRLLNATLVFRRRSPIRSSGWQSNASPGSDEAACDRGPRVCSCCRYILMVGRVSIAGLEQIESAFTGLDSPAAALLEKPSRLR